MRRVFTSILLLLLTLALAGVVAWSWLQPRAVRAALVLPEGRAVVVTGQELLLTAVASSGRVLRAELWVDGVPGPGALNPAPSAGSWSVTLLWKAGEPGRHVLFVRFYAPDGAIADSSTQVVDVVPDGQLAFVSNRSGDYAVYLMRTDGSGLQKVADEAREPAWGPEGSLILVRQGTLWLRGDDGKIEPLLASDFGAHAPAWRQRLAFAAVQDGRERVAVRDINGSLAALPGLDDQRYTYVSQPSWSPDGNELIVAAEASGNIDLYRISLVSGEVVRLSDDPARDWQPAWSPDGRALLFTSDRSGLPQVYWLPLTGPPRPPQVVTAHPKGAEQAAWAPDGTWFTYMVYTEEGPGVQGREIFLQRLADGFAVRLTNNRVDDAEPAWRPPAADLAMVPDEGFLGEFYANRTLTPPVVTTQMTARLDFDWGQFAPLPGLPEDGFSVRWRGKFTIPTSGDYRFTLLADDGARLWVDDTLVLDEWHDRRGPPASAPVHLTAGPHVIRVEYYDDQGPARILVTWEAVG